MAMKFKMRDTVRHVAEPDAMFFIVAEVSIKDEAGVHNKYLGRQYFPKDSPQWPGLSPQLVELNEMELRKVK